MPYINVKTNSESVIQVKDFIKAELGSAITAISGKTEAWLMINIDEPSAMYIKGSSDPCAMFEVSIFGNASDEEYDDLTKRICEISKKYLSVPAERTYVKYNETTHWGWNGMNF